jgi:hypothetical protein
MPAPKYKSCRPRVNSIAFFAVPLVDSPRFSD